MEEEKKEVKRGEKKKSKKWLWILAIVAVLIVGFLIYSVFSGKTCSDISCFNSAMAKCQKVSFVNERRMLPGFILLRGKKEVLAVF